MSVLAVFSCGVCSHALLRHWKYFQRQQADQNVIVTTQDRHCEVPDGCKDLRVGLDSYIMGEHLPRRMVNTISILLEQPWDVLVLAEYDVMIINRIPIENLNVVAAHQAGHLARPYYHNPWVFSREFAMDFIQEGRKVIESGACQEGSTLASPDVFFGWVCHNMNQPVQKNLWKEFSRNSLDCEGDLERARLAYRSGVDVIHGIKTGDELNYITNENT